MEILGAHGIPSDLRVEDYRESLLSLREVLVAACFEHAAPTPALGARLPARDGEIVQEVLTLEERRVLARRQPRVQVVTDSAADLPADLVRAHGIAVVPLTVAFGKETRRSTATASTCSPASSTRC